MTMMTMKWMLTKSMKPPPSLVNNDNDDNEVDDDKINETIAFFGQWPLEFFCIPSAPWSLGAICVIAADVVVVAVTAVVLMAVEVEVAVAVATASANNCGEMRCFNGHAFRDLIDVHFQKKKR